MVSNPDYRRIMDDLAAMHAGASTVPRSSAVARASDRLAAMESVPNAMAHLDSMATSEKLSEMRRSMPSSTTQSVPSVDRTMDMREWVRHAHPEITRMPVITRHQFEMLKAEYADYVRGPSRGNTSLDDMYASAVRRGDTAAADEILEAMRRRAEAAKVGNPVDPLDAARSEILQGRNLTDRKDARAVGRAMSALEGKTGGGGSGGGGRNTSLDDMYASAVRRGDTAAADEILEAMRRRAEAAKVGNPVDPLDAARSEILQGRNLTDRKDARAVGRAMSALGGKTGGGGGGGGRGGGPMDAEIERVMRLASKGRIDPEQAHSRLSDALKIRATIERATRGFRESHPEIAEAAGKKLASLIAPDLVQQAMQVSPDERLRGFPAIARAAYLDREWVKLRPLYGDDAREIDMVIYSPQNAPPIMELVQAVRQKLIDRNEAVSLAARFFAQDPEKLQQLTRDMDAVTARPPSLDVPLHYRRNQ